MEWKEFCIHTVNDAIEPISNILNEAGSNGVLVEDAFDLKREHQTKFGEVFELDPNKYPKAGIFIKAYFVNNGELAKKISELTAKINGLTNLAIETGKLTFTLKDVHEADWENEWKKYFKPTRVTNTFTVVPTWEEYTPSSDKELIITIDPGMAFGTGTHPTTILSLQALDAVVKQGDTIIDVGSGSGILTIGALLLGAKKVYAYDLDEVAVNSTKINIELNQLDDQVVIQQNNLLKNVQQKSHVVVSNILADILIDLVDDAWNNLNKDGYFITSGIIVAKQNLVKDKLEATGFTIIKMNQMENWISFIAQKPSE